MAYDIGTYRYGALIVLGLMALPLPLPLAAQHAAANEQERRQQAQALSTLIGEKTAW